VKLKASTGISQLFEIVKYFFEVEKIRGSGGFKSPDPLIVSSLRG